MVGWLVLIGWFRCAGCLYKCCCLFLRLLLSYFYCCCCCFWWTPTGQSGCSIWRIRGEIRQRVSVAALFMYCFFQNPEGDSVPILAPSRLYAVTRSYNHKSRILISLRNLPNRVQGSIQHRVNNGRSRKRLSVSRFAME